MMLLYVVGMTPRLYPSAGDLARSANATVILPPGMLTTMIGLPRCLAATLAIALALASRLPEVTPTRSLIGFSGNSCPDAEPNWKLTRKAKMSWATDQGAFIVCPMRCAELQRCGF